MAQPTRRSVLRAGVVLAAAAAPLGVATHALSAAASGAAAGYRRSTFAPHVGTAFTLDGPGGPHTAILTALGDLPAGPATETRFSLLFEVSGSPEQNTYLLEHPAIAGMDLFVVPVGSGRYEAIVDV